MQATLFLRTHKGPVSGMQDSEGPGRIVMQEDQVSLQRNLDLEEGLQGEVHLQAYLQDLGSSCEEAEVQKEVRQGVQDGARYLHQDQSSLVRQVLPNALLRQVLHHGLGQEAWSQGR